MEHPLIGNLDELTIDELTTKISELSGKLNIAARTGNAHLCGQIRMALESYRNKYQEKLQKTYNNQSKDTSNNFANKIKIQ
jgi:hypothetical protein